MERNKWKINVLLIIIMVLVVLGCILGFFYFTKDKTKPIIDPEEKKVIQNQKRIFSEENYPRIDGSTATLPLAEAFKADFTGQDIKDVEITHNKTHNAYVNLINGDTDLILVTYPSDEEKELAEKNNVELEIVPIVKDAFVFFVNKENPVDNLTLEQVQDIYSGKIKNWKEVGGADMKIVAYSRETSSGTYEFFKESVLKNKNYMSSSLSMPATGAIIQSVSQTKGAIGYVGLAYLSPRVKSLSVSYDGKHFAPPTMESATDKSYPIVRPLYYYYNTENAGQVNPLISFILSPAGQEIIKKSGYIPVK